MKIYIVGKIEDEYGYFRPEFTLTDKDLAKEYVKVQNFKPYSSEWDVEEHELNADVAHAQKVIETEYVPPFTDCRFSCPVCFRYLIRWLYIDGELKNLGGHEPDCDIEDYLYMWI